MKLLCKIAHRWLTTHVNRWMMPTRQECERCGIERIWSGGPEGGWVE